MFFSAGCYLAYVTIKKVQNGSLQKQFITIKNYLGALATEHIVEPITKLGEEFFEKLHRREGIVSREDLIQSKEALSRMLADFWEHGQRSFDVKQIMMRGASAVPSGFNNSTNVTKHDNSMIQIDSNGKKLLFLEEVKFLLRLVCSYFSILVELIGLDFNFLIL